MSSSEIRIYTRTNENGNAASMKLHPDRHLSQAYLAGDEEAGRKLYESAYPILVKYVCSKTTTSSLTAQDKEDITADTMVKSIEILVRYNGKSAFSTFLTGIANKKILEYYRKAEQKSDNIIQCTDISDIIEITPLVDTFANPAVILIEKEFREAARKAQCMLSDENREIVMLKINGMSAEKISEMTGLTIDAIKSRYRRALLAMKQNFEKIYNSCDTFSQKQSLSNRGED